MDTKHTPGPWRYRTHDLTGDSGIFANGTGVFAEAFADIRHVNENAREEALANARLIAAAPEMLEALEDARDALNGAPNTVGLHEIINRAIAKARGEN